MCVCVHWKVYVSFLFRYFKKFLFLTCFAEARSYDENIWKWIFVEYVLWIALPNDLRISKISLFRNFIELMWARKVLLIRLASMRGKIHLINWKYPIPSPFDRKGEIGQVCCFFLFIETIVFGWKWKKPVVDVCFSTKNHVTIRKPHPNISNEMNIMSFINKIILSLSLRNKH